MRAARLTSTDERSSRLCLAQSSPSSTLSCPVRLDRSESMGLAVWKLPEPGLDERAEYITYNGDAV